jgi:hypothetical protein
MSTKFQNFHLLYFKKVDENLLSANVPSAEAVPDKDREKAKHLFADLR